jgi:signal transduction histidine kinase
MNLRQLLPTDPDYAPFGLRWLRGLNALAFAIYVPYCLVRGLWDFHDTITSRSAFGKSLQAASLEAFARLPGQLLATFVGTMLLMTVTVAVINLTEKLPPHWRLANLGAALLGCAFLIRPMAVRIVRTFNSEHPSNGFLPEGYFFAWMNPSKPRIAALILEAVVFGCLAAAPIYLRRQHEERMRALRNAELRRLNAESQETEARLQSLQAQIEPHFLFNTLAHIVRLHDVDAERGQRMLRSLAEYMRSALPQVRGADFTLRRELALTRSYVEVQRIRMGERLRVEVDVPAALLDARVPAMTVLTLTENAVKHGLGPKAEGGTLRVEASAKGQMLEVAVCDDGVGLRLGAGTGHGLSNVRSRLEATYGSRAALEIGNGPAGGVRATLLLPFAPVGTRGSAQ